MSSYQYKKSHCGDKTVVRSSYLHNWTSYTGKMASLYWTKPNPHPNLWQDKEYALLLHCLVFDNIIYSTHVISFQPNQALFKRRGGDFKDNTCVQQIVPGNIVRVKTNRGTWRAKSLVVTVGPWAVGPILKRDLMLSLPLEVRRLYLCDKSSSYSFHFIYVFSSSFKLFCR